MLDRIEQFLDPKSGLVGCVDFYVSGRSSQTQTVANAGDIKRLCNWWNRLFWLHWFELDHVDLHPSRRNCKAWSYTQRLILTDGLLQTLNGGLELSSLSIVCRELPSNTTYYHNRPQLFNNPQLAITSVPSPQFPIIFGSDAKLEGMSLPVSRPSGMIP